jgi:choline dehydrogenase-like flavoprotein
VKPLEKTVRRQSMRHYDGKVDVAIVGCGAAGSVLAKELAEAGWRVVVLEAGPWLDTDEDLRQDEVTMRGKFDWVDRRWSDGSEEMIQGHRRDGRGVGGGTIHFGAVALRFWPEDFKRYSRDGVGRDWPIDYTDLEPYYDRVEQELKLSGPQAMPWGPKRTKYPQGPHALTARDYVIGAGMESCGIDWTNNALAILVGEHEGRSPCMNYGYCQWGCKSRAKTSMHVSYVPKAVRAGAEIRDLARVTLIETDASGRVSGLVYHRDGEEHRLEASMYILSAFCIENPRLLLHSANSYFPDGLANSSGLVGRGIMAHIADSFLGRFPTTLHMWSTSPGTLLSQHHYGTQPGRPFAGGWSWMTSVLFPGEFGETLVKSGEGMWGERLMRLLEQYPNFAVLGEEGECLWYADNRVTLSDERDEFGVPRPQVRFDYHENESRMRQEIERLGRQILDAAGAEEILGGFDT